MRVEIKTTYQTSGRITYSLHSIQQDDLNLLLTSEANMRRSAKILILEGIIKKNSYERRTYESVDEKSLS